MKVVLLAHTNEGANLANMAARTCYSKKSASEMEYDDESKALMSALNGGHNSVLEHVVFTFSIEGISRACSHQLVRHRMASYSQQSQRYVDMKDFKYVFPKTIRDANRILTGKEDGTEIELISPQITYSNAIESIKKAYLDLIKAGIPEEDARYILPNACATNIVVTMNARELLHFFSLRCCSRAQWEIRDVANSMLNICKKVEPKIFNKAGPSCVQFGKCPEGERSCKKVNSND